MTGTRMFDALDALAVKAVDRLGRRSSLVLWVLLMLVAGALYVRPATSTTALGVEYANLARDPWRLFRADRGSVDPLAVSVEHRLLTPAISYLIGLRGEAIIITNLVFTALLLACATVWFRRHTVRPGDALFATAVLTTSLVILTPIWAGGYCDALTYLIVFLMYWARSRPRVFYTLFLVGMLNHESVAFLTPWFWLVTKNSYSSRRAWLMGSLIGTVAVIIAYSGYRHLLTMHRTAGGMFAYLDPLRADPWHWLRRSTPYQILGLFTVFKLLWIIPCAVVAATWKRGERMTAWMIILPVVCAALQFFVAYDSSRLFTLAFMSMVISLSYALRENPLGFRRWAGPLFLVNLFVPELFTASKTVVVMVPTLVRVIQRW